MPTLSPASASAHPSAAWPALISRLAKAADGRLLLIWRREHSAVRRSESEWPTWAIR